MLYQKDLLVFLNKPHYLKDIESIAKCFKLFFKYFLDVSLFGFIEKRKLCIIYNYSLIPAKTTFLLQICYEKHQSQKKKFNWSKYFLLFIKPKELYNFQQLLHTLIF